MSGAVAPLLISRASSDPRLSGHPGVALYGIESYIAVPLHRRDGSYFGTLCALDPEPRDVDERLIDTFQLLAELIAFELEADEITTRQWRELEDRQAFLTALAHDLNTPLTAVKGYTDLLRRRMEHETRPSAEVIKTNLDRISGHINRTTGLVHELVDTLRVRSGSLSPHRTRVDLLALARSTVKTARQRSPHLTYRLDATATEMVGSWDQERLQRVLDILLEHAGALSTAGNTIVIRVSRARASEMPWVTLSITYDQCENPPHRVNLPQEEGNGHRSIGGIEVGIAGAKRIVEEHGGAIVTERQVGGGTKITIHLPTDHLPHQS